MSTREVPLCVDLDRTLTPVSTFTEGLLDCIAQSPEALLALPGWIGSGRARLRAELAARSRWDATAVPLHTELIEWLRSERAAGRTLVLSTALDHRLAERIADQLQLFDAIVASDEQLDLGGDGLRRQLTERYGARGFDYVGGSAASDAMWQSARRGVVVGDQRLLKRAGQHTEVERSFATERAGVGDWLRAIRLHQWSKNALVFVPALLAHAIGRPEVVLHALLAFLAFGLCASSVYVFNDLFDLAADRAHPRKRRRAFAAGRLSAAQGLLAGPLLLLSAAAIALTVNLRFAELLAAYYLLTWSYSIRLKRIALLDVTLLAAFYTLRIIGGAVATDIPLSFWLLAFSVFMFLSLGFVKRYAELESMLRSAHGSITHRGYSTADLPLIMSLGTSAGYCAIVVMALYINSSDSLTLYHHRKPLWLICPVVLFWISRVWTLTSRGQMHDDPLVFALRDRWSLLVLGALAAVLIASI